MRPSSLGGAALCVALCLSVCLSVCPSVPLSLPSVTWRHLANYNDTHVLFDTHRGPHIVRPSRPHKLVYIRSWLCTIFLQYFVKPPPLLGGALSDAFVWRLTSVCRLSVTCIGPNSRTEKPRKTKIGTEVGHVTCDSDTIFKVKRSKVKVTRPLCSARP